MSPDSVGQMVDDDARRLDRTRRPAKVFSRVPA